jgi:hypothetical protein
MASLQPCARGVQAIASCPSLSCSNGSDCPIRSVVPLVLFLRGSSLLSLIPSLRSSLPQSCVQLHLGASSVAVFKRRQPGPGLVIAPRSMGLLVRSCATSTSKSYSRAGACVCHVGGAPMDAGCQYWPLELWLSTWLAILRTLSCLQRCQNHLSKRIKTYSYGILVASREVGPCRCLSAFGWSLTLCHYARPFEYKSSPQNHNLRPTIYPTRALFAAGSSLLPACKNTLAASTRRNRSPLSLYCR